MNIISPIELKNSLNIAPVEVILYEQSKDLYIKGVGNLPSINPIHTIRIDDTDKAIQLFELCRYYADEDTSPQCAYCTDLADYMSYTITFYSNNKENILKKLEVILNKDFNIKQHDFENIVEVSISYAMKKS